MIPRPTLTDQQAIIIASWAYNHREHVRAVLLFGSRMTGIRRDKKNRTPIPDIDLAVSIDIEDHERRHAFWMAVWNTWSLELSTLLGGTEIDLYCCDPVGKHLKLLWEKPYWVLWSDPRWKPLDLAW